MSGLCDGGCRVCCSFLQQAFAPRMRRGRFERTPRDLGLGRRSHALGTSGDGVIVQWPAIVGHPHRSIHPFFDEDVGRPDIGPHLIELPVVGHRPVTAQTSGRFNAQAPIQLASRRTGPMQIRGLCRLNREPLNLSTYKRQLNPCAATR